MNPDSKSTTRGTDTIQINKPSNCENYTGQMLKKFNLNSSFMDRDQYLLTGFTEDREEAIRAFFDKRDPKFKGK